MSSPHAQEVNDAVYAARAPYENADSVIPGQYDATNVPQSENNTLSLSALEIAKIRVLLSQHGSAGFQYPEDRNLQSVNSTYEEFADSTHAWAIFAEEPTNKASVFDRTVGCCIICLQLFTYWLFAAEAIQDYRKGVVPITTTHYYCGVSNEKPNRYFMCEADSTNHLDSLVAFSMLGIFLASDVQQAWRAIRAAPKRSALAFACFAGVEVVVAFIAAAVSISQKLYIGEVSDAIEVGVGLLFVRELSSRAYSAIRHKNRKQYNSFFAVLAGIIVLGLIIDPICEALFAP